MADEILKIARFGRAPAWVELADPRNGKELIDSAARGWNEIQRLDAALVTSLEAISKNPDLSAKGRGKARANQAEKTSGDLDPVRKIAAKIGAELKAKQSEAAAAITPEDKSLAHFKSAEIRSWMSRDPLVNIGVVNQAFLDGDAEVLAAILDSPKSWPGRPPEDSLAGLREQRMELAMGPEATAEIRRLSEVHGDLASALSSAESGIREAAGMPVVDAVAKAAEGESSEAA